MTPIDSKERRIAELVTRIEGEFLETPGLLASMAASIRT
jgi:hypothetical protein